MIAVRGVISARANNSSRKVDDDVEGFVFVFGCAHNSNAAHVDGARCEAFEASAEIDENPERLGQFAAFMAINCSLKFGLIDASVSIAGLASGFGLRRQNFSLSR